VYAGYAKSVGVVMLATVWLAIGILLQTAGEMSSIELINETFSPPPANDAAIILTPVFGETPSPSSNQKYFYLKHTKKNPFEGSTEGGIMVSIAAAKEYSR